jgi:hypothetical protein
MKIKRTILKEEVREDLKESLSKSSLPFDINETIQRERESADETYLFTYDVLGIKCDEYYFQNENHLYALISIYGHKFDSGSFDIRKSVEDALLYQIIEGLSTFLIVGIQNLLGWLDRKITRNDFKEEEVSLDSDIFSIKTLSPARYIIIDKNECENLGFLFAHPLSKRLNKIEGNKILAKKLGANLGIRVIPLDEFFKKFGKKKEK